jgi:ferric-dicitrate binding protein FerR (iron transport regulator)
MSADSLLSRLASVRQTGADQRVHHLADVPTINDHSGTAFRRQRRRFLVRLGLGVLCALVAWMILSAIAVVVLIGCVVAFARACHEGDDGRRT